MIETLFLLLVMFFVLYSVFHLITRLITGKAAPKEMLWFWVIIALPIVGSLIYFSTITYPVINRQFSKTRIH